MLGNSKLKLCCVSYAIVLYRVAHCVGKSFVRSQKAEAVELCYLFDIFMKLSYLFNINYIHYKVLLSGQIWITLLLNVLFASGASVCAIAFAQEADISSIWCTDGATYYTFDDFWETTGLTAALVCRSSMTELKCTCNYIALTAHSDTSNFPR